MDTETSPLLSHNLSTREGIKQSTQGLLAHTIAKYPGTTAILLGILILLIIILIIVAIVYYNRTIDCKSSIPKPPPSYYVQQPELHHHFPVFFRKRKNSTSLQSHIPSDEQLAELAHS
uniref:Minor capsid protein p17 n=1 Tax=African swine fever virus TaxID=10497 RepID=A0A485PVC1_ASF|nr:D117L CDS [African swine fever virus]